MPNARKSSRIFRRYCGSSVRFFAWCIRLILGGAALAVVAVAFANNAHFWSEQMKADPDAQRLYVGFSLLAGVLKVGIPAAIAFYRTSLWRRKELTFVFLCALLFDVWSGFGYAQMTRQRAGAETSSHDQARARLKTEIADLEAKLHALPEGLRPVAVVATELKDAEKRTRCTTRWRAQQPPCLAVAELRTEHASAEARETFDRQLTALRAQLAAVPAARSSEPHVAVIANGLRNAGCSGCSDAALGYVWGAVMLAILEFAPSALFWFVARPPPLPVAPVALEQPKRKPAAPRATPPAPAPAASSAPPPAPQRRQQPAAPGSADVFPLLASAQADQAGWIKSTQRAMADALGISAAEVNRQLMALETQGTIEKRAGRNGTAVRIICPPKSASHLRAVS